MSELHDAARQLVRAIEKHRGISVQFKAELAALRAALAAKATNEPEVQLPRSCNLDDVMHAWKGTT